MKKDNISGSVGENIKQIRLQNGFTQLELSNKTGISISQISAYENNKKNIGLQTLANIAKALNCSIDDLYYGSGFGRIKSISSSKGELTVNSLVALWEIGLFGKTYYEDYQVDGYHGISTRISILEVYSEIEELISKLDDLKENEDYYPDPNSIKKQILASIANKIDKKLR